jgi:energy-coupling factor transporter transmembrane protein EcfT
MDDLQLPDTFDASDPASIVAVFAPELQPTRPSVVATILAWLVVLLIAGGLVIGPTVSNSPPILLLVLGISAAAGWMTAEGAFRHRTRAFERMLEERPYELYEQVAEKFRGEIDEKRQRLLGGDSEWQQARSELRRAIDEAEGSVTYWTDRWLEDPRSEVALAHRETAKTLQTKLRRALTELEKREQALLDFFHQCESRISLIEKSRRDHEETQRLALLSRRTDGLVVDATLAIEEIGREFVDGAIRVGQALGALDRLQLKHSAGAIDPDDIERVAERIIEAAGEEERSLSRLAATIRV